MPSAGCNQLTGLPQQICRLAQLERLHLVSNEISYLPPSVEQLTALRELELSDNALHELPRAIGRLHSLSKLWLAGNSLSRFPQHLCALEKLVSLDLAHNRLTHIPRAVAYMPQLQSLSLGGNPLLFPPPGVLSQGDAAVLEFMQRHRYADLLSSESEKSSAQVAASRDRLLHSLSRMEEHAEDRRWDSPPRDTTARRHRHRAKPGKEEPTDAGGGALSASGDALSASGGALSASGGALSAVGGGGSVGTGAWTDASSQLAGTHPAGGAAQVETASPGAWTPSDGPPLPPSQDEAEYAVEDVPLLPAAESVRSAPSGSSFFE